MEGFEIIIHGLKMVAYAVIAGSLKKVSGLSINVWRK